MKDQINVITYARVSTDKQALSGESLDEQKKLLKGHSLLRGWSHYGHFEDHYTGTKLDRPGLLEAIETIKWFKSKGIQIHYLLVHKIDRSARVYTDFISIKDTLEKLGVKLQDAQGVIGESQNVVPIDGVITDGYDWARMKPSQITEAIMALTAEEDRKNILRRTIPQLIKNSMQGYWTGPATFGFMNERIETSEGKKKSIQVPHPIESKWIQRMFQLAGDGLSYEFIANELNALGYESRTHTRRDKNTMRVAGNKGGLKLNEKQLIVFLRNPIYAGVAIRKWRGNEPKAILQRYDGLVSLDLWNSVNRGKMKLAISSDRTVTISYGRESVEKPLIIHRLRINPLYPFNNLIYLDGTERFFNGNSPKGYNGSRYSYYSARHNGKCISHRQEDFEKTVIGFLSSMEMQGEWLELYMKTLEKVWLERKNEIQDVKAQKKVHLNELEGREKAILDEVSHLIKYPDLLEAKNNELIQIKAEKESVRISIDTGVGEFNLELLQQYGKALIENIGKIASNTKEYKVLKMIFNFVFRSTPSFDNILNRTAPLQPFFSLVSQQKNSPKGILQKNQSWQGGSGSN